MARNRGIAGWYAMTKAELIAALESEPSRRRAATGRRVQRMRRAAPLQTAAARDTSASATAEEQVERSKYEVGVPTRDLSAKVPKDLPAGYHRDRIVAMVRDPYWLHCYWELTHHSVQRAEAVLGQEWHGAKPILRLLDVSVRSRDITNSSEKIERDIEIHGGCNNWYIDVASPPRSFRVDIG